jgi:multidrug efflux pump subunit AcrA (membrane-fusion protein)
MGNRFRRIAVAGITVVVLAAGAGTAYAAMSSRGPSYRLATAVPAEVTATLQEVGTLTPVDQADVGFAVSGTVQAVKVQPGQHVTAGQTLGTLDTTSLQAALTAAQSTLANANLQVHNDLASQDAAAGGSGSAPGSSGASSGTSGASSGKAGTSPAARLVSSLRPLQQAVLNAQRQADSLLARARTALAQARRTCSPPSPPGPTPAPTPTTPAPTPTTPTPTSTPSPSPTASAPWPGSADSPSPSPDSTPAATGAAAPTGTGTALASGPAPVTCLGATRRVLAAEAAVLQAQQALSGRLAALTDALAKAITAAGESSSGSGGSGGGGAASGGGTAGGSGGGGGGAASAAQLAADQASADAAAAQVTVAQQNLAAATLVSPIGGTVIAVSATPGAAAAAGSVAFEVAGLDSYQVVTQVPVTDMPQLTVGEPASVLPDGASVPLSGSVVSIGLIPDSTGSPTTYPVTIGLAGQPAGLHPGGYASVTITTARSSGVSVPTSAVHRSGHRATVTVYAGGKTRVTKVTVGTIGPVMTRITAGLRAGQQVVLADLSQPLPNTNPTGGGPGFGRVIPFGGGSVNFVGPG